MLRCDCINGLMETEVNGVKMELWATR